MGLNMLPDRGHGYCYCSTYQQTHAFQYAKPDEQCACRGVAREICVGGFSIPSESERRERDAGEGRGRGGG